MNEPARVAAPQAGSSIDVAAQPTCSARHRWNVWSSPHGRIAACAVRIDGLAFASATGLVTRRDGISSPLPRRATALIEQAFAPAVPQAQVAESSRSRARCS